MSLLVTMGLGAGGPAPDTIPPAISNITPAPGTAIEPKASVQLDVTDETGLALVMLVASYPGNSAPEVAYDGTAFSAPYLSGSTKSSISGGFRFVLLRDGGWLGVPTLTPYAIDTSGNEDA